MKTLDRRCFGVFLYIRSCDDPHMARFALCLLGAALGIYAIGLAIWEPGSLSLPAPVHVAIGWSFVVAGLVAWQQRPENRLGLLMILTGIVWFGRDFDWFGSWTANHVSELSQNLFLALLAHQVLVFPHGVTRSRLERVLVTAAYALAILAYPPSEVSNDANIVLSAVAIALAVVIVYVVVDRWQRATATERRALQPLVLVGPLVLVVVAVSIAHDYIGISLSRTGDDVLHWCALVYTAIPLVFLLGVLRTRLRRALLGQFLVELSGGSAFEDDALQELAEAARHALRDRQPARQLEELSPRELEVLALIADGMRNAQIAERLVVSEKTVGHHVSAVLRKLDVASRGEAAAKAMRLGLTT